MAGEVGLEGAQIHSQGVATGRKEGGGCATGDAGVVPPHVNGTGAFFEGDETSRAVAVADSAGSLSSVSVMARHVSMASFVSRHQAPMLLAWASGLSRRRPWQATSEQVYRAAPILLSGGREVLQECISLRRDSGPALLHSRVAIEVARSTNERLTKPALNGRI